MTASARTPTQRPATYEDFLTIPPADRFHEILDGELVRKALPSFGHGLAQRRMGTLLSPYDEGGLHGQPGGWWIVSEVEILLPGRQPLRPDIVAWRRQRMPHPPEDFPIPLLPDWVCEVVSPNPNDARRDTVTKRRDYSQAGIPHYWLVDLARRTLTTLKLSDGHYLTQAEGRLGDRLRAEPFELVEIAVSILFTAQPPRS